MEQAEIRTFLLLFPHSQPTWASPFTFARSPTWEGCRGVSPLHCLARGGGFTQVSWVYCNEKSSLVGPWREWKQRGALFPAFPALDFSSQWTGSLWGLHTCRCANTHTHTQIMPSQSMVWLGRAGLELGELPTMWCQLLERKEITQAHGQSSNEK